MNNNFNFEASFPLENAFIDFYWLDVEALFTVIGMYPRKGNWNTLEKVPGRLLICNLG